MTKIQKKDYISYIPNAKKMWVKEMKKKLEDERQEVSGYISSLNSRMF